MLFNLSDGISIKIQESTRVQAQKHICFQCFQSVSWHVQCQQVVQSSEASCFYGFDLVWCQVHVLAWVQVAEDVGRKRCDSPVRQRHSGSILKVIRYFPIISMVVWPKRDCNWHVHTWRKTEKQGNKVWTHLAYSRAKGKATWFGSTKTTKCSVAEHTCQYQQQNLHSLLQSKVNNQQKSLTLRVPDQWTCPAYTPWVYCTSEVNLHLQAQRKHNC